MKKVGIAAGIRVVGFFSARCQVALFSTMASKQCVPITLSLYAHYWHEKQARLAADNVQKTWMDDEAMEV